MSDKGKSSDLNIGPLVILCLLFTALFFAFMSGAVDVPSTWTASDMRGEVQRRLERLDEREENVRYEWERTRIEAERAELLAITESYGD